MQGCQPGFVKSMQSHYTQIQAYKHMYMKPHFWCIIANNIAMSCSYPVVSLVLKCYSIAILTRVHNTIVYSYTLANTIAIYVAAHAMGLIL